MSSKPLKILLGLVGLALIILGLTPKVVGLNIDSNSITNLVDLLPPETQGQVKISDSEFHNGWFESSASIGIDYLPIGTDPLNTQLQLNIQHGPILRTSDGLRFGLAYAEIIPLIDNAELTSALAELPFDLPELHIDLLTGFDQSLEIRLQVTPVSFQDSRGRLIFDGLSGHFLAKADQSAEFALSVGRLEAQENGSTISISLGGMELSSSTTQMSNMLAPSQAVLSIPNLGSSTPYPFQAESIAIESRLSESLAGPEQTDIYQHMAVGSIDSDFPLDSMQWTLEIKQIQNSLFDRYYEMLNSLQSQMAAAPTGTDAAIAQLGQELMLISVQNPLVLNNNLQADAYGGDHNIEFNLSWDGLPNLTNIARMDINQALAAVKINIDVALNLEAVMRSPVAQLVDPYVQQGYIIVDNGRIMMNGSIADSELTLNGDILPLDQLF